jgi:hypothetical protein
MSALHSALFFFFVSLAGGLSAHAHDGTTQSEPVIAQSESPAAGAAETLYQTGMALLVAGERTEAEGALLRSAQRDPTHVASHRKLCVLKVATSATQALTHCEIWAKLETDQEARRFARRFVRRLAQSERAVGNTP